MGRIAFVSGGSRGIGREIVLKLALKDDIDTIIINHQSGPTENDEEILHELAELGKKGFLAIADIADYDTVKAMVNNFKHEFQTIDILVNNAGIHNDIMLSKMTQNDWLRVINVNLNGVFNLTQNILPLMPDGARIINISSVAGILGNWGQCNYSASKAGLIGFTRSLAKELAKRKITVNCIAPGVIRTEMLSDVPEDIKNMLLQQIPLKEFGEPEDVAHVVAFIASKEAKYITGEVIRVDGGL
jgi:3-oxoacyl-[acyl-carrier protein] reductase